MLSVEKGPTWLGAGLATLRHGAVLPPYVGVAGETPRLVAYASRIPAEVFRVLQLWDHVHGQTVLVRQLQGETKEKLGETVKCVRFRRCQQTGRSLAASSCF